MIEAFKELIKQGIDIDRINDEMVAKHLYTKGQHDPELVVRTGGHIRLSNFLLWQTAYSELYFTQTLWPDFDEAELKKSQLCGIRPSAETLVSKLRFGCSRTGSLASSR